MIFPKTQIKGSVGTSNSCDGDFAKAASSEQLEANDTSRNYFPYNEDTINRSKRYNTQIQRYNKDTTDRYKDTIKIQYIDTKIQ